MRTLREMALVHSQRLDLNPFAVFLAIAFCVWLWGPVGAFLAVPLLMATTVSCWGMTMQNCPMAPSAR